MKNSARYISKIRLAFFFLFFVLIFFQAFIIQDADAAVSACSASVSPTSVVRNTTNDFTFTISNTDSVTYNWIKITRPSASVWTINSGSATGWSASANSDNVTFTGGSVAASGSLNVAVNASAADFLSDSTAWTVQASDNGGGATFNCTGSLGTSITNPPADLEPQMSDISVSDVTSSSVKITWTTNENATSVIDYGTTSSYGSTKSDSTPKTSHSLTLDGLTANTTYHYNIKGVDSGGNTGEVGDNTFVAAKASSTATTTTKLITPTPTPTPIPDKTAPLVKINTSFVTPFEQAPTITGSVYDASGINKIEYSVDNGKSWISIRFDNVGYTNIRFDIKPESLEEDNYKVKFRSFDAKSNIGYSKTFDLVIDRLPPRVGGAMFFIGPQIIFPDKSGVLNILQNIEHSIVFSAIGGPVKMELFSNDKKFRVSKDKQSGLWTAKIKFEKAGKYSLMVKAEDGAGKKSEKKIADINVVGSGKILDDKTGEALENAKITVYLLHPKSKRYVLWDGKQYSQNNPAISDKNGQFGLYLPSGTYYITVSKPGYIISVSDFFTLERPTSISHEILLSQKQKISLGLISLYLPDIFFKENNFVLKFDLRGGQNNNFLIGKEASDFSLKTVSGKNFNLIAKRGTPLILTFVSSWSPPSLEQILVENKLKNPALGQIYLVDIQESLSKISIFQKRGGYSLDFIVDSDGTLVEPYGVNFLPMHFVLDRKGVVRNVISGVLNKEELENYLKEGAQ